MKRTEQQDSKFREHLATGALTSKALQERLSISQTALSRTVQRNKKNLLIIGAARSTRYALRKNLFGIGDKIPVYEVDPAGDVHPYATLYPLAARQYGWQLSDEKAQLLDHLPYMIQNIQPEGFMGRAFAHNFARDLGLPEKLEMWSDEHTIAALAQRGEDFVGNLIIGKESVERYLIQARSGDGQPISLNQRDTIFEELAEKAIADDTPGSSAGGEQPKFTALLKTPDGYQRAIVKFANRMTDEGRRWSDLLVCEHLANDVLLETGFSTAQTEIVQTDDWTFLQSIRFDRVGLWGRLPLYSLMTIASEFVGYCGTWMDAAEQLFDEQLIAQNDVDSLRRLSDFGTLIGNTDMHLGNISLIPKETGFTLAPVYDMTPMYYRPKAGGVLPQEALQAGPLSIKINNDSIAPIATRFWQTAQSDTRITDQFRSICRQNIGTMRALGEGPTMRL